MSRETATRSTRAIALLVILASCGESWKSWTVEEQKAVFDSWMGAPIAEFLLAANISPAKKIETPDGMQVYSFYSAHQSMGTTSVSYSITMITRADGTIIKVSWYIAPWVTPIPARAAGLQAAERSEGKRPLEAKGE